METLTVVGRMMLSLGIVLAVMWLLARWARNRNGIGRGGRNSEVLAVLARKQLSRTSSVAVVQVMDRALIIGVTDGQVTHLGDTDLAAVQRQVEQPAPVRRRPALPAAKPRVAASADGPARSSRALAGSALSGATWRQALDVVRERTVRR